MTVSKFKVLLTFCQSKCSKFLDQKQISGIIARPKLTIFIRKSLSLMSYHACILLIFFLKSHVWAQCLHTVLKQGSESSFEWADGSAFDYIPWKTQGSPGNCLILNPRGIWKHEKCLSVKDGAICYKPTKCKTWLWATVYLLEFDMSVHTSLLNEHFYRF